MIETWLRYGDRAAARRAAVRRLHPDVGGSTVALSEALDAIDRAYSQPADSGVIIVVHRSRAAKARSMLSAGASRITMPLSVIRRRRRRPRTIELKDQS